MAFNTLDEVMSRLRSCSVTIFSRSCTQFCASIPLKTENSPINIRKNDGLINLLWFLRTSLLFSDIIFTVFICKVNLVGSKLIIFRLFAQYCTQWVSKQISLSFLSLQQKMRHAKIFYRISI